MTVTGSKAPPHQWAQMLFWVVLNAIRGPVIGAALILWVEPVFRAIAERWPYEDRYFFIVTSVIVHEVLYFGMNTFFLLCDTYGWFAKYKIYRSERMIPSSALFADTLKQALVNHFLAQPVALWVLYPLVYPTFAHHRLGELPSFHMIVFHFVMAKFCNEIFFYLMHRLLHHPKLYKHLHKQHHKYVGTIGFASEYAGHVEQALANDFPTVIWCFAMGLHPLIWLSWLGWRLWETYEAHSGYCFVPSLLGRVGLLHGEQAAFHDWHHSDNRGNFGNAMTDAIGNTDASWRAMGGVDGIIKKLGTSPSTVTKKPFVTAAPARAGAPSVATPAPPSAARSS